MLQRANDLEKNTYSFAKILWDYHHVNHLLRKSDVILVLGSNDIRVAERGADLYLQGYAPLLIFSGGLGNFTQGLWEEPEADKFAKIAVAKGVPKEDILIENRSTNTGENIRLTQQLLAKNNLDPLRFILVQKPFMERRSYATFKKSWPGKELMVTSPQIPLQDYPNDELTIDLVINAMVGDLQRIQVYPGKGFQIPQEIPNKVWKAYEALVAMGYDQHLIQTE